MTFEEFEKYWQGLIAEAWAIQTKKGVDYAGREDKLANFKNVAQATGLTPLQVWGVYAKKHIDAVFNFVKHGQVESEPIRGRIVDIINYLSFVEPLAAETQTIKVDIKVPPYEGTIQIQQTAILPPVKKQCAHKNLNITGTKCEDCGQDLIKGDPTKGAGAIISSD